MKVSVLADVPGYSQITRRCVTYEDIERRSHLYCKACEACFSDEEAEKMTGEFESILGFQSIDRMDLENVDPDEFADRKESIVRADENVVFGDNEKLFSNAGSMRGTFIQVPGYWNSRGVRMSGGFKDAKRRQ